MNNSLPITYIITQLLFEKQNFIKNQDGRLINCADTIIETHSETHFLQDHPTNLNIVKKRGYFKKRIQLNEDWKVHFARWGCIMRGPRCTPPPHTPTYTRTVCCQRVKLVCQQCSESRCQIVSVKPKSLHWHTGAYKTPFQGSDQYLDPNSGSNWDPSIPSVKLLPLSLLRWSLIIAFTSPRCHFKRF